MDNWSEKCEWCQIVAVQVPQCYAPSARVGAQIDSAHPPGAANRWFAWVNFPKCWFSRHQKRNLIWCNVHVMRFMVSCRNFPKVSACTVVNPRTRPACGAGAVLAKDQSFVSRLGNLLFNSQTTQTWVWLEKGASMDLQRTHKWFVIYIYLSESTIQKLKVRLQ